jgi:uncharacterized repeat protein (TIGR03803 family)
MERRSGRFHQEGHELRALSARRKQAKNAKHSRLYGASQVKIRTTDRAVLGICAATALLAACGGSQPSIGAPGAVPQSRALAPRGNSSNYKVLYRFTGKSDGALPDAALVGVGRKLYGTTQSGGSASRGVVFSITRGGTEKPLYSFNGAADGGHPVASLIDMKDSLYGTTRAGGHRNGGTVFRVTTGGAEQVLHDFRVNGPHGEYPDASLIGLKGKLYGTTFAGGGSTNCRRPNGCGTVFSVTPSGTEIMLYGFKGGPSDGAYPVGSLLSVDGTLYGTTDYGGAYSGCNNNHCGTVFSITTSGVEKVLHSFGGGSDGANPVAGLIDVDGTLYGTTLNGGTNNLGTVFSITPSGSEKVVYSFARGTDGNRPAAGLVDAAGTLYGTTSSGGGSSCSGGAGCGTVYSISPSGAETVLYSFAGGSDGIQPHAALLDIAGVLYGTTTFGGGRKCGCGTIFALTP